MHLLRETAASEEAQTIYDRFFGGDAMSLKDTMNGFICPKCNERCEGIVVESRLGIERRIRNRKCEHCGKCFYTHETVAL
ncbi:MAG: hypothetical protein IKH75_01240 [Ruminococcus sp.]|nr:hypothetical protein [Ruminococcus sp.]